MPVHATNGRPSFMQPRDSLFDEIAKPSWRQRTSKAKSRSYSEAPSSPPAEATPQETPEPALRPAADIASWDDAIGQGAAPTTAPAAPRPEPVPAAAPEPEIILPTAGNGAAMPLPTLPIQSDGAPIAPTRNGAAAEPAMAAPQKAAQTSRRRVIDLGTIPLSREEIAKDVEAILDPVTPAKQSAKDSLMRGFMDKIGAPPPAPTPSTAPAPEAPAALPVAPPMAPPAAGLKQQDVLADLQAIAPKPQAALPVSPAGTAAPTPAAAAASASLRSYSTYARPRGLEDIPLSPQVGGRSIGLDPLMAGDIILSTEPGAVSGAIRGVTGAPVSHAMLYLGSGEVGEAVASGVVVRTLEEAIAGASLAVAFRDPRMTQEAARRIQEFVGQALKSGARYDFVGIVKQLRFRMHASVCDIVGRTPEERERCRNWVGRVDLGTPDNDRFICSQLVLAAFEAAGLPLTATPPNWSSPGEIADLRLSGTLEYVGHLKAEVRAKSFSGAPTTLPPTLVAWQDLIQFRPPIWLQKSLRDRVTGLPTWAGWPIQTLESAQGPINLDYYPVTVSKMPTIYGSPAGPAELLNHIRLNINNFVDPRYGNFEPSDDKERVTWLSPTPLGAIVHIDMRMGSATANPDDGSVACTRTAYNHWVFSTIWTVGDLHHPVNGNRQFGYTEIENGACVFYTRGADRPSGLLDNIMQGTLFAGAHAMWMSFQQGIASFVNANGGTATVDVATSERYDWTAVERVYHNPTESWNSIL